MTAPGALQRHRHFALAWIGFKPPFLLAFKATPEDKTRLPSGNGQVKQFSDAKKVKFPSGENTPLPPSGDGGLSAPRAPGGRDKAPLCCFIYSI